MGLATRTTTGAITYREYREEDGVLTPWHWVHARRGDTVRLTPEQEERFAEHLAPLRGDPGPQEGLVILSAGEMTDEQLAEWIKDEKPTVSEVVEAAEDDPVLAKRLLAAEHDATNGSPRKTLVAELTAIEASGGDS